MPFDDAFSVCPPDSFSPDMVPIEVFIGVSSSGIIPLSSAEEFSLHWSPPEGLLTFGVSLPDLI